MLLGDKLVCYLQKKEELGPVFQHWDFEAIFISKVGMNLIGKYLSRKVIVKSGTNYFIIKGLLVMLLSNMFTGFLFTVLTYFQLTKKRESNENSQVSSKSANKVNGSKIGWKNWIVFKVPCLVNCNCFKKTGDVEIGDLKSLKPNHESEIGSANGANVLANQNYQGKKLFSFQSL